MKTRLKIPEDPHPEDNEPWIMRQIDFISYIGNVYEIPDVIDQNQPILIAVNNEFVTPRVLLYDAIGENTRTKYPLLLGAFDVQRRGVVAKNVESLAQFYQFKLHAASGRYDGRLLIAKKSTMANGLNGRFSG